MNVPDIPDLRTIVKFNSLFGLFLARTLTYSYDYKYRQIGQSILYKWWKLGWLAACDLEWWQNVRLCHKVRPWPPCCRSQVTLDRPPAPRVSFFFYGDSINCIIFRRYRSCVKMIRFLKWFLIAKSVLKNCSIFRHMDMLWGIWRMADKIVSECKKREYFSCE